MADISVVIPVYNAEKTLPRCLDSIFNQSSMPLQIIAVNDGSTDSSAAILELHRQKITIINQLNRGAAAARNKGADIATGRLIIFSDADVVMEPSMLEKMRLALDANPQAAYAYSQFKFGFKTFRLWPFDSEKLRQLPYIHTTSLMRRADFPGFDKTLMRFQDWDLWLTMLEHGQTGIFIPEILFTVASGGTMSAWLPRFAYTFTSLQKVRDYKAAEEIIRKKHHL